MFGECKYGCWDTGSATGCAGCAGCAAGCAGCAGWVVLIVVGWLAKVPARWNENLIHLWESYDNLLTIFVCYKKICKT